MKLKIKVADLGEKKKARQSTASLSSFRSNPQNQIYEYLPNLEKLLPQVQFEEECKAHAQKTTNGEGTVVADSPLYYANLIEED